MSVTELIEKHGSTPAIGVQLNQDIRWELKRFAIELLEMVKAEKRRIFLSGYHPSKEIYAHVIDEALEELRNGS